MNQRVNIESRDIKRPLGWVRLHRCKAQYELAQWAIGAMESLSDEDQTELWGCTYEACPVAMSSSRVLSFELNVEVAKDFLYHIEEQYVSMASQESTKEYNKALPIVLALANKVRALFGMTPTERAELVIHNRQTEY